MKLCIILVCLFSFSLSATTLAQRERVSMKLQEVSLRQVLEQIREQTNLQFMMSKEQGTRGTCGTGVRERRERGRGGSVG